MVNPWLGACLFNDAELEPLLRLILFRRSYLLDAELEPLLRLTLFRRSYL